MTAQGTIIGQIQPTQAAPGSMQQVGGSPAQIQQLQQGGQTVTMSTPQQVHLPATVPSVKEDLSTITGMSEPTPQTVNVVGETTKENCVDGKSIYNT